MFIIIKDLRIDVIIKNKTRYLISTYFFLVIFIKHIVLSLKRDFIFELK